MLEEDAFIPAAVDRILERDPELELAKTQAIEIIEVESEVDSELDAEETVDAEDRVDDEISDVFATVDAAEAEALSDESKSESDNTKTRVIELPEKSENELF
jgi:hypothetical protein